MWTPWVSFDGKDCSGCKHLNDRGYCEFTACIIPCTVRATIPEVKPQTNFDRFRAMSDMEIASFFYWDVDGSGKTQWQWLEWLRQECE